MPDLSKIEAWIQNKEDELLYDVDGEAASLRRHRRMCTTGDWTIFTFANLLIDPHTSWVGGVDDRDHSE